MFIATNFAAAIVYFFFLPETSGLSLEEVAALFGDELVTARIGEIDVHAKEGLEEDPEPMNESRSKA